MSEQTRQSLGTSLRHTPVPLRFGTSGRRGEVKHLTQLEIYLNVLAELRYLQGRPASEGGIERGEEFYFAQDLRPSSTEFVPEQHGRGEIAQAVAKAIEHAGMRPVNLGQIPTPALTCYALARGKGSIMVTGSHIPFDRNGYKTNSTKGELGKQDEGPVNLLVEQVRAEIYAQPAATSLFDHDGFLRGGSQPLLPAGGGAREFYLRRYCEFFRGQDLQGKRLLVYQHSAVGRDLLVELLQRLGAEAIPAGRSDSFVPIDTENMEPAQLRQIDALANEVWRAHGPLDAIVSTDGDSDRPLILSAEPGEDGGCQVRFFGGDLVGMVVAEYLQPDAVVVPISCNDGLDQGPLKERVQPKTKIGSPYVLAGMEKARRRGYRAICGWEANGGFLTGSDWTRHGHVLPALPTRDAMLPILAVLFSAVERNLTLGELFDRLPKRFSKAGLLRQFPRAVGQRMVQALSPKDARVREIVCGERGPELLSEDSEEVKAGAELDRAKEIATRLEQAFGQLGAGAITRLNFLDGVRIYFTSGEVAHLRPSGNADEMRIYAVANTPHRADEIVRMGVAEPDGILRVLERCAS
jgi:phosphomannomutase